MVGVSNLANGIGGFIFLIASARLLPTDDYAKFAVLTASFVFFAKITELGTTPAFVTLSIQEKTDYSKALLKLKVYFGLVAFVLCFAFLNFFSISDFYTFFALSLGFIGYLINDYLFALFQLKEDFLKTSLINFLPAVVKAVFALLAIASVVSYNFYQFSLLYLASLLVAFPLAFSKKALSSIQTKTESEEKGKVKQLLVLGTPAGVSQALILIVPLINSTMIKSSLGLTQVASFALAEKISTIFSLASLTLFTVFLPKNAQQTKKGLLTSKTVFLPLVYLVLSLFVMLAATGPLLKFIFNDKYQSLIELSYILSISAALTASSSFLENIYYIFHKTKVLFTVQLLKIFILLTLNLVLIKTVGVFGVAFSNLGSSFLSLVAISLLIPTFIKRT